MLALASACGGGGDGGTEADPTASPTGTSTATATEATTSPTAATPSPTPQPLHPVVREMIDNVAEGRGLAAPEQLAADVISRDELPAVLEGALTDLDRRSFEQTTLLYRLLGYLEPDEDYYDIYMSFARLAVIGLYDPLNDHLYVVTDDGRAFDDLNGLERETLAHEVVHALQDYHFALDKTFEETVDDLDRNLAFISVVEGDAVVHETLAEGKQGRAIVPAGRLFALADLSQLGGISAPIERELRFPYTTGAQWVSALKARDGTATIDELLGNPPSGTAVVLHPERGVRWEPERPSLPGFLPLLGDGWARDSGGTFGEFHWMNLLQTRLPGLVSAQAAATWRGDSYSVYRHGDDGAAIFRGVAGPELHAAMADLLEQEGDNVEETNGVLSAELPDGRYAGLAATPDGFLLVIATDQDVASRLMQGARNG
jgi:hypothetical protein